MPRILSKINLLCLRRRKRTNESHKILRESHHFHPRVDRRPDPVTSLGTERQDNGRVEEELAEHPGDMLLTYSRGALSGQASDLANEGRGFSYSDMLVLDVSVLVDDEDRWRSVYAIPLVYLSLVSYRNPAHHVLIPVVPQKIIGIANRIDTEHYHDHIASKLGTEVSEAGTFCHTCRASRSHELEYDDLTLLI